MKKWYIVQITAVLLIAFICIGRNIQKNRLYDQNANERWGEGQAQLSIFYPLEENPGDSFYFLDLAHRIEKDLESSAVADSLVINGSTGLSFPWSYCVPGKIKVSSDKADVELSALGVSEDFFFFHPVELVCGSYIQADDLMKDGIILDEDSAWKLFGSNDIVGQMVTVGGVPHFIKGVVRKSTDRFSARAGLEKSICFTSIETLASYGNVAGSYAYELIMPNPVDNFAINLLRTTLGQSGEKLQIIENSNRFDNSKIRDILLSFGIRSMSSTGIIYPYYENVARAWEDAFSLLLLIQYVLTTIVIVILVVEIYRYYKAGKFKKHRILKWFLAVARTIAEYVKYYAGKLGEGDMDQAASGKKKKSKRKKHKKNNVKNTRKGKKIKTTVSSEEGKEE